MCRNMSWQKIEINPLIWTYLTILQFSFNSVFEQKFLSHITVGTYNINIFFFKFDFFVKLEFSEKN